MSPESSPVTRFAPSPTGHLHIGGARTALYCWALARGGAGRFLLRVEDTDRARSSESASLGLLEDLAWLGIGWDEGPDFEGPGGQALGGDPRGVGPFRQALRLERYAAVARGLVERDLAYPAFDTPEELEARRAEARAEGGAFRYRRPADWDRPAALARMEEEPCVLRFRMPAGAVTVRDAVLGEVEFGEEVLDDFVMLKRDGFPTYHLAVVVDDEAMGVSHVLRGQEHLNNTPRHLALQRALGYREPIYAHLPVIQNADGSKLSKRDKDKRARQALRERLAAEPGLLAELADVAPAERLEAWLGDKRSQLDTGTLAALAARLGLALPCVEVEDFRAAGFLSEVLCNFLALLGWSPGEKDAEGRDLERFDRDFLAQRFSLERVGVANARFDPEKLAAFNQDAIAALDDGAFFSLWSEWCARYAPALLELDAAWRRRYAAMVRTRCRTLADAGAADGPGGFAWCDDEDLVWEPAAVKKWLARGDPPGWQRLAEAREALADLEPFEAEGIEARIAALAEGLGVGMGKLAQPLRVAVTGRAASPPLGETLAILGPARVGRRIERCLAVHRNDDRE